MNWADEPATENQLSRLWQLGGQPGRTLTKREAARLISELEEYPDRPPHRSVALADEDIQEATRQQAYRARMVVEIARREVSMAGSNHEAQEQELARAATKRQEFWADTCREAHLMQSACPAVVDLYRRYGCRFSAPSHEQIQVILDALDSAMPVWDREHPELFYQTLELNFRELLRRA